MQAWQHVQDTALMTVGQQDACALHGPNMPARALSDTMTLWLTP